MKRIILFAGVVLLMWGCRSGSDFKTVDDITESVELKGSLISPEIIYNGTKVKTAGIDKVLPHNNDELVLVNFSEKSVYIAGLDLKVKKKLYLRDKYESMLRDRLFDAFINKDTLFLADNSMSIKKVNLNNGTMETIPLKGMIYFSQPYHLTFGQDGNYIYTFVCFPNTVKDKVAGDFVCGSVFTPKGEMVKLIPLQKDLFTHEAITKDNAMCLVDGNRIYLTLELEKNALILDSDFNKIDQKALYINKDWRKPQTNGKQFSAYIINNQPLVKFKDKFIQWPPAGNVENKSRLVVYDKDFNPLKKIFLAGTEKTSFYNYTAVGDNLVVYSAGRNGDENIYIYDLKNL